jgi:hypothetical protein
MDIVAIQQMAHTLVKSLTGFDSARIVREKADDGAALKVAGAAIMAIGDVIERAVSDGAISMDEVAEAKAAGEAALDAFQALGIELKDQQGG